MRVSPLTIRIMFACYCSPDCTSQFVPLPQWQSPAGIESRAWLVANALIERDPNDEDRSYRATERGIAWVKYICETPLPIEVKSWQLPARELVV